MEFVLKLMNLAHIVHPLHSLSTYIYFEFIRLKVKVKVTVSSTVIIRFVYR